jgi:carboxylate-amine ligase
MSIPFRPSESSSVGVEIELQILAADTHDLSDGILPLLEAMAGTPWVKSEFIQNTVEIASMPCTQLHDLELHLREILAELLAAADALGFVLCGAGTHPFSRSLATITPTPRYRDMEKHGGVLVKTQITFATHVHVGVGSGEEAIALMRALKPYLPVLVAISANSPYWRGYETGFVSYRQQILAAGRSYGIPPTFTDWAHFERFFETTRRAGVFESIRDIHWDIRPRPDLGTIELRVMDAQSTLDETLALVAFVRALVSHLRASGTPSPVSLPHVLPWWLEKENKYQASRRGLRARYIAHEDGRIEHLADIIEATLDVLAPTASALGDAHDFERARALARAPGYQRQRQAYARNESTREVVDALVEVIASTPRLERRPV